MGSQRKLDYCHLSQAPAVLDLYAITIRLIDEIIYVIYNAYKGPNLEINIYYILFY